MNKISAGILKFLRDNWILIAFSFLRVLFGVAAGVWFPATEGCDDVLMMNYASLRHHFLEPDLFSLAKYMGFPIFLDVVYVSHLPYAFFTSLLWVAAAAAVKKMLSYFVSNRPLLIFLFIYTLFLPIGYEQEAGLRLYRNALIAPCTLLVFGMLLILMARPFKKEAGIAGHIAAAAFFGFIFTFTFYIKEDGIWYLAVLLFADAVVLINAAVSFLKHKKADQKTLYAVLIMVSIPLLVFLLGTAGYKKVNHHFFGVSETNTRTDGELGRFVQHFYSTDSEERTDEIWAPADAIDQVFEASETLKSRPEIYEDLLKNPWSDGDLKKNGIRGDWISWAMRYAADCAWNHEWNEKEISDFFSQVNREIDAAFEKGILKKADRIQLLPSGGGKTWEDIWRVAGFTGDALLESVALMEYGAGVQYRTFDEIYIPNIEAAAKISRTPALLDYNRNAGWRSAAKAVSNVLFVIYRALNVVLLVTAIAALIWSVVHAFTKRGKKNGSDTPVIHCFLILFFFALAAVYAFSICWFSSFLFSDGIIRVVQIFYTAGVPAILTFAYGFGSVRFLSLLKQRRT